MELSQQVDIPRPPKAVWQALNDPEVLKQALPGCESFEPIGENQFEIQMTAKVGPVKAKFKGEIELTDVIPPTSYVLSGAGKGGVAGFAKGSASVKLEPLEIDGEAGTRMTYEVQASVGGKLAQIGSRLVTGAAKKTAADFFDRFTKVLCGEDTDNPQKATSSSGNT